MRLVTREAGLVQHVTSLKTQLQGVVTQVLQGRECCQYAGDAGLEDQRVQVDGTVGQWDTAQLVAACQSDMVAGGGDLQGGYHEQLDQLEAQLLQHHQSSDCSQEQS